MEFRKALMSAATARKIADKRLKSAEAWHEIVAMIEEAAEIGCTSLTCPINDKLKYLTEEDVEQIRAKGYVCSVKNNKITIIWEQGLGGEARYLNSKIDLEIFLSCNIPFHKF